MKKKQISAFTVLCFVLFGAAALFSLLNVSFHADISLLAFPIAVIFTGLYFYFAFYKFVLRQDGKRSFVMFKMTEWIPFVLLLSFILRRAGRHGTPFWYDVITVLLWLVVFVTSFLVYSRLNEKKIATVTKGWKIQSEPRKKYHGGRRILFEAVEWIDYLCQAIFTVLLFQIFFFQLYEIPSESMVPTFLIKDRVVVSKIDCGPKFPLTDVGLPDFRTYRRGDTIVFRNPHYKLDRESEVKSVTSQLIYMLTFMQVNLNRDEHGELKADPLVKRITGEPGEQLVMQDGVLYARTKGHDFEPVTLDQKFACWNLNAVPGSSRSKIRTFPLSASEYDDMLAFEEERRNFSLAAAAFQVQELSRKFSAMADNNSAEPFSEPDLSEYALFANAAQIARRLLVEKGGADWLSQFLTSWIPAKDDERDLYAESNFRLNAMTKLTAGRLLVRYAELYKNGASEDEIASDELLSGYYDEAETLHWYIQGILDSRNMPVFPANDAAGNPQYIPKNCYFMMGDNRFNSLDLRHANEHTLAALTPGDPLSVQYYSIIAPQYINKKYILGKPVYRFWPAGRLGSIK